MKKLVLRSSLTSHQKFVLSLIFLVTFLVGSSHVLSFLAGQMAEFPMRLPDYIGLILFPVSLFALLNLLSKHGFVIKNNELRTANFIFNIAWYYKKMDLSGKTDISILKFKGAQKYTFATVANPNKAYRVYNNSIYLLNSNHTVKDMIFTTQDEFAAEKAVNFINESFSLTFSKYSPPVVRRRR